MKYNLKTDNYKTFEVFKDNVMYPRSYFIPFSSPEAMENTDIRNERYSSDMVECLSGQWDFAYYKCCYDIPDEFDTDKICFDKVCVPSVWQHTGYEEPYYLNSRYPFKPNPPYFPEDCSAGVYRRFFSVEDTSLNYCLAFLGVAGAFDLFCNGKYVGYSEGSHNTSQFELNDFIRHGENEIVVLVHKWSNGTYLECQDMFRSNGIFRDVLLYKTGDNSIYDFEIKTDCITAGKGGRYSLNIIPSLKITDKCELCAYLYDDDKLVASCSVNQSPQMLQAVNFDSLEVCEWSAECPYLYDLVLALSKGGEVLEVVRRSIGFKGIEITGNVFRFNNKPIKLLGVNHHDTNPKTGYVMTVEDMERDIRLVKEYNGNCIRTSHYPPDPTFLDLCDEYGIYVVDEADIETHGCGHELHREGACSHNPAWQEHYWDRVYRMFERDKNHPCITMWSLGNESHGYKNQDYCYAQLKKLTDIPVHYEGVCRTRRWAYDVISQMYTFPNICEKIASGRGLPRKFYKKPFYLCEYAHAMGVGAGELERYVKCFYSADNMLGGCIWEFADHAVYHESGKYEYTYGGDHGEMKHDGNFCVDGLFYPDRAPHSGAKQMKNCYRPVRASMLDSDKFLFTNHRYFENAQMTVNYKVLQNGFVVKAGSFDIDIEPQDCAEYDIERFEYDSTKRQNVQFEYFENGRSIAFEEIIITEGKLCSTACNKPPSVVATKNNSAIGNRLYVTFDKGSMIFNMKTGTIDSYIVSGRELINQLPEGSFKGMGVQLYRAPLDNDMNLRRAWERIGLDKAANYASNVKYSLDSNALKISFVTTVKTPCCAKAAVVNTVLYVYSNGEIKAEYHAASGKRIDYLPRFGVQLELNRQFENIKYCGLGPDVNMPDFKEHAVSGIYETTLADMPENHIKPQESAVRCETVFAEITDGDSVGIRIEAVNKPFIFSARSITPTQCAKAMHREDLTDNTCCVNIDGEMLGAGSNSCGPPPSKQFRPGRTAGKSLSFVIKPIGE